jgi:hypothetical protein
MPPPRVAVEVSNTATQLGRLLAQSDLVSILSESQLQGPAGEGLVALSFAEARFVRKIGALTRKGSVLPPLAQRFRELLLESAAAPARTARKRTVNSAAAAPRDDPHEVPEGRDERRRLFHDHGRFVDRDDGRRGSEAALPVRTAGWRGPSRPTRPATARAPAPALRP